MRGVTGVEKYAWVLTVAALCWPCIAWSQVDVRAPLSQIYGAIAVHGCEVDPAELLVRARPVLPPQQQRAVSSANQRSKVVKTTATTTPGKYAFLFDGVAEKTPYRLGVKLIGGTAQRCGKMAWASSRDPLVLGGQEGVTFEAYTVSSQIEVLGEAGPNRAEAGWFGADGLEVDDVVKGTRQIRWRSNIPGVTGGRLQVSLKPFPRAGQRGYNPCAEGGNNGVVHEINFDAIPGEWTTVPVNFNALLGGGRSGGSGDTRTGDGVLGLPPVDGIPVDGPVISELDRAALNAGRPIHVRVLPKVGDEVVCDPDRGGIPPEVILAIIKVLKELPEGEPVFSIDKIYYTKPTIDTKHPKKGEICYRVTKKELLYDYEYDFTDQTNTPWHYAIAANSSKSLYDYVNPGFQFCVPNSYWDSGDDDGWFESFVNDFGSVLTAIVDAAGKLVNFASKAWEDIQDYAVKSVAAGLSEIPGVNCGSTCQAALEMGLEVGLASMGVPPSLPNFDQFIHEGADYLMAQAGSQLGVPSVLTDYASDEAQKFIKKAVKDMQDRGYSIKGLPAWLVPDIRFEPAFLTLALYGSGVPLPSQPGIIRANDPVYAGKFVQLPKLLPKKETILLPGVGEVTRPPLLFPMVLDPNSYGLPSPPANKTEYEAAVWDKEWWMVDRYKYGTACYHLFLTGLAPLNDHVFGLGDYYFKAGDASPCQP